MTRTLNFIPRVLKCHWRGSGSDSGFSKLSLALVRLVDKKGAINVVISWEVVAIVPVSDYWGVVVAVIDGNIYIWELFGGRIFLGGCLHTSGERKGDRCWLFCLGLWFPGNKWTGGIIPWDQHFSGRKLTSVLDLLHQDTLRYSIVTICRNIKLENNNQGMDDGGRLNEGQ